MLTSTDPISDLLTRIRNAATIRRATVTVPYSKAKSAVVNVLSDSGWIGGVATKSDANRQVIEIILKYDEHGQSIIRELRRVSRPGRRVYVRREDLPIVANNLGMAIISTSKGMMTNREARRRGLGGEVVCEVE